MLRITDCCVHSLSRTWISSTLRSGHHVRGGGKSVRATDGGNTIKWCLLGYDLAAAIVNTKQLWLPAKTFTQKEIINGGRAPSQEKVSRCWSRIREDNMTKYIVYKWEINKKERNNKTKKEKRKKKKGEERREIWTELFWDFDFSLISLYSCLQRTETHW